MIRSSVSALRAPSRSLRTAWLASSAMLMLAAVPAAAQTADQAVEAAPEPVQDIVVTAQKRTENVQNIPKAVVVISQDALQQAGVTSLQDIGRVSPSLAGLSQSNNPSAPPAIRGVSSFAFSIGVQAQTGVVLDDVPQPSYSTLANDLTDVVRVEVLPGPQSTLSGRNAAGGLINVVTHGPTERFEAHLTAEQTDDHQTRIGGYLSGPLTDTLAYSLSGYTNQWRGNIRSVNENDLYLGGRDGRGIRGKLQWKPTDKLTATITGFYTQDTLLSPAAFTAGPYIAADAGAGIIFDTQGRTLAQLHPGQTFNGDNLNVDTVAHTRTQLKNYGGTLRLDYDTGLGTLSSITSYSKSSQPRQEAIIGIPLVGLTVAPTANPYAYSNVKVDYKTQEVRLTSPGDGAALQYLAGVIYSDTDNTQPYYRPGVFPVNWNRESRVRSVAGYGRATYTLQTGTALTGGLRYQHDNLNYSFDVLPLAGGTPVTRSSDSSNYDFLAGEVSLQQEFARDIKGYVNYSISQTGQAYDLEDSGTAAVGKLKPLASEKVHNVAVGLKSQFFDRRVTFNVEMYRANYKNYQVQSVDQASSGGGVPAIRLFAIGKVRIQGLEATVSVRPTSNLTGSLNFSYLDAQITDYPLAACYKGQTVAQGCSVALGNKQANLAGTRMPAAPKTSFSTSLNYKIPLPSLPFDATTQAFLRYQSSARFDLLGNPRTTQGAFALLNLTAGIKDRDGVYALDFFVNNVTNKRVYGSIATDAFSAGSAFLVRPVRDSLRYAGARLTLNYK